MGEVSVPFASLVWFETEKEGGKRFCFFAFCKEKSELSTSEMVGVLHTHPLLFFLSS